MCRTFSILLSFLIILNSSGYVLIYIERLANNKHDIEAIIATSKDLSAFEKFIFTKEDFKYKLNWKDEKEFELNGNMFVGGSCRDCRVTWCATSWRHGYLDRMWFISSKLARPTPS